MDDNTFKQKNYFMMQFLKILSVTNAYKSKDLLIIFVVMKLDISAVFIKINFYTTVYIAKHYYVKTVKI